MTLTNEKQTELKQELEATRAQMSTMEADSEGYTELEKRADEIIYMLQSGDFEERTKLQEEKVLAITLPHDFSKLFEDPRANDIIMELLQECRREANAEHNQEIAGLINAQKAEKETDKQQIAELQQTVEAKNAELHESHQTIFRLNFELEDMTSKREAAVKQAETFEQQVAEKDKYITELQEEILHSKAAATPVKINSTNRLAELVKESENAKIKSSMELALERTETFRGKVEVSKTAAKENQFQTQTDLTGSVETPNLGGQFQPIPKAQVPAVSAPVASGNASEGREGSQTVTREELEARLQEFVTTYGLVKRAS